MGGAGYGDAEVKRIYTDQIHGTGLHTKGRWAGQPFDLIDWQEQIIRDIFGVIKPNGYRQFNTAYVEIPKKQGKSELAAAVALYLCCGDGEQRAEVYSCASDRQQASIVFEVAMDMVRMTPALAKRTKILASQKKMIFEPTNSIYQNTASTFPVSCMTSCMSRTGRCLMS